MHSAMGCVPMNTADSDTHFCGISVDGIAQAAMASSDAQLRKSRPKVGLVQPRQLHGWSRCSSSVAICLRCATHSTASTASRTSCHAQSAAVQGTQRLGSDLC